MCMTVTKSLHTKLVMATYRSNQWAK